MNDTNEKENMKIYLAYANKFKVLGWPEQKTLLEEYAFLVRILCLTSPPGDEGQLFRVVTKHRIEWIEEYLLKHNFRLILSIAKKFQNRGLSLAELLQDGCIGFVKAIRKFSIARGCRLSTFATWWTRQGISRGIEQKGSAIRIPIHIHAEITNIKKHYARLTNELQDEGRDPTSEELATATGYTVEKAKRLGRLLHAPQSLDEVNSEDNTSLMDYLESDESTDPESYAQSTQDYENLLELMGRLPAQEEQLLWLKFGLLNDKPRSEKQIAAILGIQQKEVKKIYESAMKKLRAMGDPRKFTEEDEKNDRVNVFITQSNDRLKTIGLLHQAGKSLKEASQAILPAQVMTQVSREEADLFIYRCKTEGITALALK